MIIEKRKKSSIVEEVMNFKKEQIIEEKQIKPADALLNVEIKEEKCDKIIECANRKEVAEQRAKLKEQHIKHKIKKQDDKFIIECFENIKEDIDGEDTDTMTSELRRNIEDFLIKWIERGLSKGEFLSAFENIYETVSNAKSEIEKKHFVKESLKETFSGEDIIDDLADRAKSLVKDGYELEDAVHQAIDDGLIYTRDIIDLGEHYGTIDTSALIESFYDDLFSDIFSKISDEDYNKHELLGEDLDDLKTSQEIKAKIEKTKSEEIPGHEERIAEYKKEQEETSDENRKKTLSKKIEKANKEIEKANDKIDKLQKKLDEVEAEENLEILKKDSEEIKDIFSEKDDKKKTNKQEVKSEVKKAYDTLADFLKDNASIRIETSPKKVKSLKWLLPELEENQYTVKEGTTSGGYPMKFGISAVLHVNNIEACPEKYRALIGNGNDITDTYTVIGLLKNNWDDFKDAISTHKEKEVKEGLEDSIESKIKSKVLRYLDKLGYSEKDFNDYFVISVEDFVNDDGDKGKHIQLRNDLTDFYEAEELGLISELDNIVAPGYFEPYDAYVWDAYIWDFDLEEDLSNVSLDDPNIDEDLNEGHNVLTTKFLEDDKSVYVEYDSEDKRYYIASDYDRYQHGFDSAEQASNYYKRYAKDIKSEILDESLTENMSSEVINWWKDVEDANVENKWEFDIDNDGYRDVEAMHAAMFDMLDALKEKGAFDLFNKGKKIYNKYAKYSKYNESLEESITFEVNDDGDLVAKSKDNYLIIGSEEDKDLSDAEKKERMMKVLKDFKNDDTMKSEYDYWMSVLKESLEESRGGFVCEYKGYRILDAGDRFVITDNHGTNVGETKFGLPVAKGMIDLYVEKDESLKEDVDIHVNEDEVTISDASGEDVAIIPIKSEEQEEDSEDDNISEIDDEEVVVDFSDDDMSEEDAKFFENLNISNNYKNEFKSAEQQKMDEELGDVVIKDNLGVEEDLSEEELNSILGE